MAGRDVVGEAVLLLELEDHASGEMAAAVEEFKAEAAALGREKAEIKLKADISEFKRKMAEARAELARLEAAEKREAARNAELSAQQKAASTRRLNGLRDERRAVEQNVKANNDELQSLQRKASVAQSVNRMATQLTRERTAAEKASAAASRESAKATDDAAKSELRRAQALSRGLQLQEQYIRAQQRAEKASKAVSRAQGSDKVRVQVTADRALADMERLRLELEAMGRKPIDVRVRVNRGDVSRARAALNRVGDAFGFTRTDQIKGAIGDLSRLTSWAKTARVNIGPLTTTIRGMVVGMAALGPVVTGVIGTLGALVSVVGAGVVGAAGVGAAALSGFGLATLGIASSVKPFLTSLQQAHTYTTALHTAVNKYGAGSKQAQKAQEQFNREMKTLPPLTRDTITGFEGLRKKWLGLTGSVAQKNIGNIIGSAFKTANADMGVFAKGTNQAFTAVTGGWQKWMAQLRSPGARQAISNIMGNFAQSIPNIMGGLGSLGAVFGRVISNFSNFLPHLSRGFAQWANGIKGASNASGGFANGVRHSVDAMRSLGHFAEAAGRVLINFFKAGIGPGVGLVNNMTNSLSHLADRMGTVAGQRRLTDFFSRSIGTTKQLFSALSPLISAFAQWSQAMAPIANIALHVVSAVAKLVGALAGFAPLKWTAGLLIGLSILGRLSAALRETAATAIGFGAKLGTALRGVAGGGGLRSFRDAFAKAAPGAGAGAELASGVEAGASAGAPILASGVESGAAAAAATLEGAGAGIGAEAASGIEGGGAAAGAEMAAAIEGAGAAAAAEMGTAAAGAGAAGAAGAAGLAAEAGGGAAALAGVEGAAAGAGAKVGILGRAFAALTSPVGLAGLAIGGFVLAAVALQSHSDTVAQSNKALADSFGQVRNAAHAARDVGTLPGIRNQAVTPMAALPGDRKQVNSLQAEYNKLTAQGATNSAHYRDVLNQLNQAILQQTNDQQAVQRASQQASQAHQADAKTIDGSLRGAYKDLNKAQAEDIKAQSEYKAGIISLKDRATAANNLARAHQNVNKILQQQRTVEFQLAADSLNAQRIAAGRVAATNAQSVAVGKLATEAKSLGGQAGQKALQFLIKTPNPADIAKISGQIDTLTPKDKTVALKILGDSKNAEEAIRRINALQVHEKVVRILANMGDALFKINGLRGLTLPQKVQRVAANIGDTLIRIARVRGITLPAKTQRLLHAGDPETIGKILQIRGLGIPSKTLHILGDVARALAAHNQAQALSNISRLFTMLGDAGPALSAWNAVNSAVHNITASVTLVATQIVNRVFHQSGNANPPPITQYVARPKGAPPGTAVPGSSFQAYHHRAAGAAYAANGFMDNGLSTNTVMAKRQIQAEGEAQLHAVRQVRFGGVYDRPTIVVGEERKREYVIATNSAYRDQNVGFLAQAAGDFGYELVPLGTTRQNDPHTRRSGGVHMFAASGHRATAAKHKAPSISKLTQSAYPGAYTVPARDRIGGVGTDDIDNAVSRAQQRADAFHQKIYASGYKRHSSDKAADDRNYNILRQLQALQASANNYIQIEKNKETDIQSVASYMSAASSSPDNAATGLNPLSGRVEHNSWATWKSIDVTLLGQHRDLLQRAFNDARRHVKANASAHNLNYIKTLSAALGQSVVDLQAAQAQQPQSTEITFDDWLASINYQRPQQMLQAAVALAATNNVPDNPLTPVREDIASLSDDLAASQHLRDFYANMLGAAQAYRNPLTHQPDYPLITAAANAFTSARDDAQRISDQITGATTDAAAVQPPQVQLYDTARALLYQQFGENTSSIGQSLANAASSAATVNQILNASVASPHKTPDVSPAMQKSLTVNNHFLTQPKDPHTWSQSVGWELQNAI